MSDTLLGHISALLDKKSVRAQFGPSTMSVSLKDFCSRILVDALTRTLFGSGIYDVEPNMVRYLLDFNEDAWMLVFQYPQSARSKLNTSKGHDSQRVCGLYAIIVHSAIRTSLVN